MRDYNLYLEDILESIKRIERTLRDISKEKFRGDIDIQDAVLRRLEIIGEAASNIPSKIRDKYPFIEWKEIIGFRIVVAHSYFKIDFDIVWDIIKDELPKLKGDVNKILDRE